MRTSIAGILVVTLLFAALFYTVTATAIGAADHPTTTAHQDTVLYQGPGKTFLEAGVLPAGVEVEIVARNRLGNWLHLRLINEDGITLFDGWTMTGYLNLGEVSYSEIPVNTQIADADLAMLDSRSMATLYAVPIIPTISQKMHEVYVHGLFLRNQPGTITKVGDSLSASESYLVPMSRDDNLLGAHDDLAETVAFFGASAALPSVASRIGMSSLVVFDPMWATDERCQGGESPLACEYRLKQPSIALILFGPNDVLSMDTDTYKAQMRKIVQTSLDAGVIPVLSTFSADPEYEFWWQSIGFNIALTEIAAEYEVPLMNLWAAARALPEYGLDEDRVHLKHSGFERLKFDTGHETWYGVSLQNLLAIRTLDEIRRALKMG